MSCGWLLQKRVDGHRTTQKRPYFTPQILIAAAFSFEECLTPMRRSLQRRVIDPLDLAAAFTIHGLPMLRRFYRG
jgi:hypothetical protein